MTTTPVSSTPAAQSSGNSSVLGAQTLSQNFDTFLTLLTTQLQNQDPLSPLDTNQFTQQLVSFSEVEQQINTNSNLQKLITMQTTNQALSALPLMGQNVSFTGDTVPLSGGKATFGYTLPTDAKAVTLTITDASGNTVYSVQGETTAGTHGYNWDGTTNAGTTAPDGPYTLTVTAADANNKPITATITGTGKVDGVSTVDGTVTLDIGGVSVPLSNFLAVAQQSSSASN